MAISVTTGRRHLPEALTRALTVSAVVFWVSLKVKMADRYWLPTSLPWRFSVVGSCMRKNHFSSNSSSDKVLGSKTTLTDSAWPDLLSWVSSYFGLGSQPPVYPD